MWSFFAFLIIGILLGISNKLPEKFLKCNAWFQKIGIVLLLFSMGASIGSNKDMIGKIKSIGIKSLSFAFFACLFSVLITYFVTKNLIKDEMEDEKDDICNSDCAS